MSTLKTVLVLGAAYGGAIGIKTLAAGLPTGWRIVVVDRNTHANHAYILPRLAVLPGHEHKGFIPLTNIFHLGDKPHPHLMLHAHVTAITPKFVTLSQAFPEHGIDSPTLGYDYAIYALGSRLPEPLNLWGAASYHGTKPEAIDWLKAKQKTIEDAGSILVVGGGALGIQFATDINALYPTKSITLLHSRRRLLPKFDEEMHYEVMKALDGTGITAILGERLDLESAKEDPPKRNEKGERIVRTVSGREIAADFIMLCTGQQPNTQFLREMDPETINPDDNLARVLRTLQLTVTRRTPSTTSEDEVEAVGAALEGVKLTENTTPTYPNIFVVGDSADAFDAIQAGHTAYYQSIVAAKNIIKLAKNEGEPLEEYTPGLPAIKVSLGLRKGVYQSQGVVGVKNDGVDDMNAAVVWPSWGAVADTDEDMHA